MSNHIKNFLPTLLDKHHGWKVTLLKEWPTIIGTLKDKVILEKIDEDSVVLGVVHPAWIQELSLLKPIILQAINDQLENPYIKTIRIKTSSSPKKYVSKISSMVYKPLETHTLSLKEKRALEGIKDSELKDAMKLFLLTGNFSLGKSNSISHVSFSYCCAVTYSSNPGKKSFRWAYKVVYPLG